MWLESSRELSLCLVLITERVIILVRRSLDAGSTLLAPITAGQLHTVVWMDTFIAMLSILKTATHPKITREMLTIYSFNLINVLLHS